MKPSIKKFSILFTQSAWEYTRPILSFDNRYNQMIIILGIILSNGIGLVLSNITPMAFTLVNVGSFLGTVICTLPSDYHPTKNAIEGIILISCFTSLGIFLKSHSFVIIIFLGCSLYIAGVFQNISVGTYINWIFGAISLLAGSQLKANMPNEVVLKGLATVIIGMIVFSFVYCIFNKDINNHTMLVKRLYKQLYLISINKPANYIHTRVSAQTIIEYNPILSFSNTDYLKDLIYQADLIASSLTFYGASEEDSQIISYIQENLNNNKATAPASLNNINSNIKEAAFILQKRTSTKVKFSKSFFPAKKILYKFREFASLIKNTPSKFAVRLAMTGIACHIVSIVLSHLVSLPLIHHEFWIVITGCLMTMPGFHGTVGKIASRTIGSIMGVLLGSFLHLLMHNLLELNYIYIMIFSCLLVILYEIVRKLSQAFLMLSVTIWITFILGGATAGITRLVDVLIGAIIASIIFSIFPTWHRHYLQKDLEIWSDLINSTIVKLALNRDSTSHVIQWSTIYKLQRKIDSDIQETILESPLYCFNAPTRLLIDIKRKNDRLLNIQDLTENLILNLIYIQGYLDNASDDDKKRLNNYLLLCSNNLQSIFN
ncbi:TPA: FUSC family protein [Enterococcus faecalis]|nr:FUSC family protein [Enterococcus faecalis]